MIKAAKRCYSLFAISFFCLLFQSSPAFCQYSGGQGTQSDPYKISDANDWQKLMQTSSDWDKHFILTTDINMVGKTVTPIGNSIARFNGSLNGNNHLIEKISIIQASDNYLGLFGYIQNGKIENLQLEDVNIVSSTSNCAGCLAGINNGTIINCSVKGDVCVFGYAGGLAGQNSGNISKCFADGSVSSSSSLSTTSSFFAVTGGLVGYNLENGIITDSNAKNSVSSFSSFPSADAVAGGLVGENSDNTSISNCYAAGSVSSNSTEPDAYSGGLIGINQGGRYGGMIKNCYAEASVSSTSLSHCAYAGGLVGYNYGGKKEIHDCYSNSDVFTLISSNISYFGGFIGYNYASGIVANCFASGTISFPDGRAACVGGFTGVNESALIKACYATNSISMPLSNFAQIGGFAANNHGGTISDCYAAGSINAFSGGNVGGLIGSNDWLVINSYSAESFSFSSSSEYLRLGGLIGGQFGDPLNVKASFWDMESSGITTSRGGVGLNTNQMKTLSIFVNAGWQFADDQSYSGYEWILQGDSYPKLAWQIYKPVTVPNLRGLTVNQAQTILNGLGVVIAESYQIYDSSLQSGLIAAASYAQGTKVYSGLTKLHLFIAKNTKYSGGDGSTANPYKISNIDNWQELMISPFEDRYKNFIMTEDINLSDVIITPIDFFGGEFNGNGHTISNIFIDKSSSYLNIGLFSVSDEGEIKNLNIENINIKSSSYCVGGLIGYNHNGIISNVKVSGSIALSNPYSDSMVGGLAGINYFGRINNCSVSMNNLAVNYNSYASSYVGGLVGYNWTDQGEIASITNSDARGSICSNSMSQFCYVGGLTGKNNGIINNSNAIISVLTKSTNSQYSPPSNVYTGGLVGFNSGSINNCYSGGSLISDSNSLDVRSFSYIGGLIGYSSGEITNCYSSDPISSFALNGNSISGGFMGDGDANNIAGCFWDKENSGQTNSAAGTGLTSTKMKTQSIFSLAGWDFVNVWGIGENQTYPYLKKYSAGDINQDNVVNYFDLAILAQNWLNGI